MYKIIVAGIDSSEFSNAAVIEASNWIRRHGGKLILVHGVYFDEEEFSNAPQQLEKRVELGKTICNQLKDSVVSEFGIEVEAFVSEGEPPEVIKNTASRHNADLIAMGTYGRTRLKRMFMGSVTSGVIVNAPCDVLVVKKPCHECIGVYKSILLPFDGSEFSRNALNRLCALAKIDRTEITALYVIPRYEEMIGFLKTKSIRESLFHEARKITESAMDLASEHGVTIETMIKEGNAGDRIIETARELKNDLIVMGTYGWRGVDKAMIGSTTERMLMHASCPVLVVR